MEQLQERKLHTFHVIHCQLFAQVIQIAGYTSLADTQILIAYDKFLAKYLLGYYSEFIFGN